MNQTPEPKTLLKQKNRILLALLLALIALLYGLSFVKFGQVATTQSEHYTTSTKIENSASQHEQK